MIDLGQFLGFDWDNGNNRKSLDKHGVSLAEAEQVFHDARLLVLVDDEHSADEKRFHGYGQTADGRRLQVSFTLRAKETLIRIISARAMSRKERAAMTKKTKKFKTVPRFRNEAEERVFWESHDTADYFDLSKAQRMRFPNLKLSTTAISLRLPQGLLDSIKVAANKRDVPYQSLIKVWLTEKIEAE
jgi:uncharacterized DUF497 family protein